MAHYRLGLQAFIAVFQPKQTKHQALLHWLREQLRSIRALSEAEKRVLMRAVEGWEGRRAVT